MARRFFGELNLQVNSKSNRTQSSAIIEYLRTSTDAAELAPTVIFYYLSFDNLKQQNFSSFLCCIIYQLCIHHGIPQELQKLYAKCRNLRHPQIPAIFPTNSELLETALNIFSGVARDTFLIVDALDEIPSGSQREDFLGFFNDIAKLKSKCLRVLVSSRNESDFDSTFQWDLGWTAIGLNRAGVDVDIRSFISDRLKRSRKFAKISQAAKGKIASNLLKRADGM